VQHAATTLPARRCTGCARQRWSIIGQAVAGVEQLGVPASSVGAAPHMVDVFTSTVWLMKSIWAWVNCCRSTLALPCRPACRSRWTGRRSTSARGSPCRLACRRGQAGQRAPLLGKLLQTAEQSDRDPRRRRGTAHGPRGVRLLGVQNGVVAQLGPRAELRVEQPPAPAFGQRDRGSSDPTGCLPPTAGESTRRAPNQLVYSVVFQ